MKYKVSDIKTKVIADDFEDVTLALKATVKNMSRDEDVYFTLQGVDEEGFELTSINIDAEIPIGEERTITTNEYINSDLCKRIVNWQLK